MKPAHRLVCLLPALGAFSPSAAAPPTVLGRWLTDDKAGIIQIAPCGDALCGTLVRVLDPQAPTRDINNPDPKLRTRSLEGVRILTGLKGAGNRWRGGRAYDPKVGRSYRVRIALGSPSRLDVTGCMLFLCQTRHWTRVVEETVR